MPEHFLKESHIIVLDEPNSSLDPISELELFKYSFDSVKEKFGTIVSHKFSLFSKIVVLSDGEIAEVVLHKELIRKRVML
ncbi:hypothetical protein [Enterococcus sp. AZ196]|uniref:hypothetical protein n=1 Tax=Enterococcus sp. AZ196 TaxID=2774659 RepID=UPI003D28F3F7